MYNELINMTNYKKNTHTKGQKKLNFKRKNNNIQL